MTEAEWSTASDVAAMVFFLTKQRIPTHRGAHQSGYITQDLLDPKATDGQMRAWVRGCMAASGLRSTVLDLDDQLGLAIDSWVHYSARALPMSARAAILRDVVNSHYEMPKQVCPACSGERIGKTWYHGYKGPRTTLLPCERCDGKGGFVGKISGYPWECNACDKAGWRPKRHPCVRGCWVVSLLAGESL